MKRITRKLSIALFVTLLILSPVTPAFAATPADAPPLVSQQYQTEQIIYYTNSISKELNHILRLYKYITSGNDELTDSLYTALVEQGEMFSYNYPIKLSSLEMTAKYQDNYVEVWSVWLTPFDKNAGVKHYITIIIPKEAKKIDWEV